MKRLDLALLLLLTPLLALTSADVVRAIRPGIAAVASEGAISPGALSEAARRAQRARARAVGRTVASEAAGSVGAPVRDDDANSIRERLRRDQAGTYIGEILLSRDSALARWPEREMDPLRVWVGSGHGLEDWDPAHPDRVRAAFTEWSRAGIPVRFSFVLDSADADIHVTWTDRFREPISGKTLWSRDRHWWIVGASITLALHHKNGDALDASAVRAIALHEVGHLLGLDHTADSTNIMTSRVRVRELSQADKATIRLLYSVPPGSIK